MIKENFWCFRLLTILKEYINRISTNKIMHLYNNCLYVAVILQRLFFITLSTYIKTNTNTDTRNNYKNHTINVITLCIYMCALYKQKQGRLQLPKSCHIHPTPPPIFNSETYFFSR